MVGGRLPWTRRGASRVREGTGDARWGVCESPADVDAVYAGAYIWNGGSAFSGRAAVTVVQQSEEFAAWLESLDLPDRRAVNRVGARLAMNGFPLGDPRSSALRGSRFPLRELRPRSGASPLRVLHAFDPRRDALILPGGNEATEASFHRRAIARAETIWIAHLERLTREDRM